MHFKLKAPFQPRGDQPRAIRDLSTWIQKGNKHQTLRGATGTGKTFTMAHVIQNIQKPTLVISHNKTLAAQLASEFQDFFPENAVHYFVSYYDYYLPESYIPRTDTYIEKETNINEEIDRLRHASTQALLSRKDVLIIASVSCIYGLGSPQEYKDRMLFLEVGIAAPRQQILRSLTNMQYTRNDTDFHRGTFRARGDVIEIFPAMSSDEIVRVELFGDTIEKISFFNSLTGKSLGKDNAASIFPAKHYLAPAEKLPQIIATIKQDAQECAATFKKHEKEIEAQRIVERTNFDMEMVEHVGYCSGIENYSRYFDGRNVGEPPYTLLDYFPDDFLLIIDESHMTIPQIRGMYAGDRSRKEVLVEYGFRLPAALDNRPLNFKEFEKRVHQAVYVSATPGPYELEKSGRVYTTEQLIRPTGLLDPVIYVRPTKNQIDDLLEEIHKRFEKKQRVLITTLTKRMAEELDDYLKEIGVKSMYLHSEIDTFERIEILRDLRTGVYDVVVGINLLREGLDLPEVSLVIILDADKEGFLRSETSLIQTMGRAARHADGTVIMYTETMTGSMKRAIAETKRRRVIQAAYNKKHGITPTTIQKEIKETRLAGMKKDVQEKKNLEKTLQDIPKEHIHEVVKRLTAEMELAAKNLEFEKAAELRDIIEKIKEGSETMLPS